MKPVARAGRLLALRDEYRARLREKPKALQLLDELFANPFVSVSRVAGLLQVSNPTARQTVGLLESEGVLEEITGKSWGKLYLARPILQIIEAPPEPEN